MVLLSTILLSTVEAQVKIKWMTIEEADKEYKKVKKPFIVDVYTDWCGWCKVMDKNTFTDPEVVNYINSGFYAVKLNAEQCDTLSYSDTTYTCIPGGKPMHKLAVKLLDGQMSYPTLVIIDRERNKYAIPGYQKPRELLPILVYFFEEANKTCNFEDFQKHFKISYPDSGAQVITKLKVKWMTLNEAQAKMTKEPRKIFIDMYTTWRTTSTMMTLSTYNDPKVAEYLNTKFYPVRLDAQTKDTITAWGNKFINENQPHQYHQLPIALLQGKMVFPMQLYFNEEMKLINSMQAYLTPEQIEPMLRYFGEDTFKTQSWEEYIKSYKSEWFKK